MIALIQKELFGNKWITGFCGTPSEIINTFLDSGVTDIYRSSLIEDFDNYNTYSQIILSLSNVAMSQKATLSDVDSIDFQIMDWSYKCIKTAETVNQTKTLCDYLDKLNSNAKVTSGMRWDSYQSLLILLQNSCEEQSKNDIEMLFRKIGNLAF